MSNVGQKVFLGVTGDGFSVKHTLNTESFGVLGYFFYSCYFSVLLPVVNI